MPSLVLQTYGIPKFIIFNLQRMSNPRGHEIATSKQILIKTDLIETD